MVADGSASLPESAAAAWRIGNDIGVCIDEEERGSSERGSKRRMDRGRPEELVISQSQLQSQSQLRNDGTFSQSFKNVFGKLTTTMSSFKASLKFALPNGAGPAETPASNSSMRRPPVSRRRSSFFGIDYDEFLLDEEQKMAIRHRHWAAVQDPTAYQLGVYGRKQTKKKDLSKSPLHAVIEQRNTKGAVFLVLLVELLWFLVSAAKMPWGRAGLFEARHLRLSRMGSQPLTVGRGGVVEFGVLERNCRSDVWMWLRDVDGVIDSEMDMEITVTDDYLQLDLPYQVQGTGFWLKTWTDGDEWWSLSFSSSIDGQNWKTVGGSSHKVGWLDMQLHIGRLPAKIFEGKGRLLWIDYETVFGDDAVAVCVLRGTRLLAGVLAGLLAVAQMGGGSRSLMKTAIALPGLISLVQGFKLETELAAGSRPAFHPTSRVVWFVYGFSSLLLVPLLTQWGDMLTPAVVLIGLANLAVAIVEGTSMLGDEGLLAGNPPVFTIIMVLTSLGMSFYTNRLRKEKQKSIESDISSFQELWMALVMNEQDSKEMTNMQTSVKRLHHALQSHGELPRQFNGFYEYKGLDNITPVRVSRSEAMEHGQLRRGDSEPMSTRSIKSLMRFRLPLSVRKSSSGGSGIRSMSIIGGSTPESRMDRASPVTCLDQLYTSARVLQPMLRHKVQRWALGTRGCFRMADDKFELWENIVVSTQKGRGRDDVKWTQLKPLTRAIEKLEQCYFGDVSRLVDIVRERIVFRSMRDLHLCLKLIMLDKNVRVVRVTNRYRPSYDLFQTAGYRDLRLNLVIQNQLTADIGVDTHVAELQLVYESFASLVTRESKERYRLIRNQRTEESGIYAAIESLREYLGETRFFGGCFDGGEGAAFWGDLSGRHNGKVQREQNETVEGLNEGSWNDGERESSNGMDIPDDEDTITFPRLPQGRDVSAQKRFWTSGKFINNIREATFREKKLSKSTSESFFSIEEQRRSNDKSQSTSLSASQSRSQSRSRSKARSVLARIKSIMGLKEKEGTDSGMVGPSGTPRRGDVLEEKETVHRSELDGFHIPSENVVDLTLNGAGRTLMMDSVVLEESEHDVERATSRSGGTRSYASRTASGENFMRTSSASSILRQKQYQGSRDSKTQSVEFCERVSSLTKSGDVSLDIMKSIDDAPEDGGPDRRLPNYRRKLSSSSPGNGKGSSTERSQETGGGSVQTLRGKLKSAASSMESVLSRVTSILSLEGEKDGSSYAGSGSRKSQWRDHQDLLQAKEECSQHVRDLETKLGTTFRKYSGEERRTQSGGDGDNVEDLPRAGVLGWSIDQSLLIARAKSRGDAPNQPIPLFEDGGQVSDLQEGLFRRSRSYTGSDGSSLRHEELQGRGQEIRRTESENMNQRPALLETGGKDFKKVAARNVSKHDFLAAPSTLQQDGSDSNSPCRSQENGMRASRVNGDEAVGVVVVAAAANGKVDESGRGKSSVTDSTQAVASPQSKRSKALKVEVDNDILDCGEILPAQSIRQSDIEMSTPPTLSYPVETPPTHVAQADSNESNDVKSPKDPKSPSVGSQALSMIAPLARQFSYGKTPSERTHSTHDGDSSSTTTKGLKKDKEKANPSLKSIASRSLKAVNTFKISPSDEMLEQKVLSAQFCRLSSMPSNVFQAKVDSLAATMGKVSTDSLSFTTAPIRAMILRTRWQVLAVACSLSFLSFALASFSVLDYRFDAYPMYRFTALQTRGGGEPVTPGISDFSLLLDGCEMRYHPSFGDHPANLSASSIPSSTVDGPSVMVSNPRLNAFNGWSIVPSFAESSLPDDDAVEFKIEGIDQSGRASELDHLWFQGFRTNYVSFRVNWLVSAWKHCTSLASPPMDARDDPIKILPSISAAWLLAYPVAFTFTALLFFVWALLGIFEIVDFAHKVFSGFLAGIGGIYVTAACVDFTMDKNGEATVWLLKGIGLAALSLVTFWKEGHSMLGMACFGVYDISVSAILTLAFDQVYFLPVTGILFLATSIIALGFRMRGLLESNKLIARDRELYDRIWEGLFVVRENRMGISELANIINNVTQECDWMPDGAKQKISTLGSEQGAGEKRGVKEPAKTAETKAKWRRNVIRNTQIEDSKTKLEPGHAGLSVSGESSASPPDSSETLRDHNMGSRKSPVSTWREAEGSPIQQLKSDAKGQVLSKEGSGESFRRRSMPELSMKQDLSGDGNTDGEQSPITPSRLVPGQIRMLKGAARRHSAFDNNSFKKSSIEISRELSLGLGSPKLGRQREVSHDSLAGSLRTPQGSFKSRKVPPALAVEAKDKDNLSPKMQVLSDIMSPTIGDSFKASVSFTTKQMNIHQSFNSKRMEMPMPSVNLGAGSQRNLQVLRRKSDVSRQNSGKSWSTTQSQLSSKSVTSSKGESNFMDNLKSMLKKRPKDPLENSENVSYIRTLRHYGASATDMMSERSSQSDLGTRLSGGTMMKNRIRDMLSGQKNPTHENALSLNHRRITSLDQLYAAAVGLQPILIDKVKSLALESGGLFTLVSQRDVARRSNIDSSLHNLTMAARDRSIEFVRWSEVKNDEMIVQCIKWASLKSPLRAAEKANRVYSQDVSCLLDICRQSIIFDDFQGMAKCIQAMEWDTDIQIVRIKNRFSNDYNAKISAGYRDVSVNLRISSPLTKRLGVSDHICEVQLLHRSFAEVKLQDGHRMYRNYRNALAQ